jgi:hypothetical protein
MNPNRRQRPELPPGSPRSLLADQWDEGFSHLKQFSDREGHCRVSQSYRTDGGYRLGQWVATQRTVKDAMKPDRRERLESLPRWSWDPFADQWEEVLSRLKEFSDRVGHCRVLYSYKCDDGYQLGQWVKAQRGKKDRMGSDRQRPLEALPGWVWRRKK